MKFYVRVKHPITGEPIAAVPTGKQDGDTIEVMVITPGSNLTTLWIKRGDLLTE